MKKLFAAFIVNLLIFDCYAEPLPTILSDTDRYAYVRIFEL